MPSRSRIGSVHHEPAAVGRLHDVVEEVVADDRAALLLAEEIDDQHVARLQHVDDGWLESRSSPGGLWPSPASDSSTSGRIGMNCAVKARPDQLLAGMEDLEAVLVLVPEALPRQHRPDLLGRQTARALDQGVGHLRPAVREPLERILRAECDELVLRQPEHLRVGRGRQKKRHAEGGGSKTRGTHHSHAELLRKSRRSCTIARPARAPMRSNPRFTSVAMWGRPSGLIVRGRFAGLKPCPTCGISRRIIDWFLARRRADGCTRLPSGPATVMS